MDVPPDIVGASLLAKASGQTTLMLNVMAPSRAGSLLQGFVVVGEYVNTAGHCGSELAREGVRSDNVDVECTGLIASRLNPKGICGGWRICKHRRTPVGASLLAKASGQTH
ncbi:hypothetical protein PkoCFBP13504_00765 [Pseudomonas koreensis]|nr:hypothetical protein PkoCFBP13504_00765 [Pseudomonas koreensis]